MRFSICVVLALALLSGCRSEHGGGIRIDRKLAKQIPDDADMLAGVDLGRIEKTEFYRRNEGLFAFPLGAVEQKLGSDEGKDIVQMILVHDPAGPLALIELSRDKPFTGEQSYRGVSIMPEGGGALALLPGGILAAAPFAALKAQIDRSLDGRTGRNSHDLANRLGSLPSEDQVWAISSRSIPVSFLPLRPDLRADSARLASYISSAALGAHLDSGIQFSAHLECINEDGAKHVRDAMRGGIALARLTVHNDSLDLLRLYDAIQIDQDGPRVEVRASFTEDLVDKLLRQLPNMRSRAGQLLQRAQ